uniref:Choline transporter-like protein n=1 Tax=Sander lucioperca TaxID=283035 RepID=A0A8D0A911_SANLU
MVTRVKSHAVQTNSCCAVFSAWIHGDPRKVIYPTDSHGQFCGHKDTPNANKAILFYFNMLKCANPAVLINLQCPTTQLCVSKCPDRFSTLLDAWETNNWEYYKQFCKPGFKISSKVRDLPLRILIKSFCCHLVSFPLLPLSPCYSHHRGIASLLNAKEVGMKIFEDYANSWKWILIGLVMTMAVSLVFILLLRYTAGVFLWLIVVSVIAAIGYGIWHCYWEYSSLSGKPGTNITISDIGFHTDLSIFLQLRQTWLIFMICLSVIEAIIVVILIFLRTRLRIAIALLKEGSRAISYIMSTLLYPIITFLLLAICIAYWVVTALYPSNCWFIAELFSFKEFCCIHPVCSSLNTTSMCPGSQCMFAFYGGESVYHRNILVLHVCNLFVFLWLVNFTMALGQCALAGAFASYYWALKKPNDIPACPLYSSFSRAIRYHTGSLAFGSLILSVVQMIRIVLEYLDHKLKGSQNACTRFMLCCLKCCFWCLEHVIRFINRNAYIMIAIYGKNFCTSSNDAFFLLMRNVIRVAVLDKVTDFLLFLGKLLISGSVGVLAFFFFTHKIPVIQQETPSLNYCWVPLLTVIFGSYMIAHGFLNVYAMCVDTLFLCFCEDLERNDGSSSRPYYMSPGLHKILRKGEEGAKLCTAS